MAFFTVIIGEERHTFNDVGGKEVKFIYDNGESGDALKRSETLMQLGVSYVMDILYNHIELVKNEDGEANK